MFKCSLSILGMQITFILEKGLDARREHYADYISYLDSGNEPACYVHNCVFPMGYNIHVVWGNYLCLLLLFFVSKVSKVAECIVNVLWIQH